ncbi:hypothetical protein GCM10022225_39680 [Plantactinospora mayteni]|uniref:Uncharacterized protein n=2 Tax=Plantactinospora mayteni TaxID=566021 RepID=A0ABQ4EWG2_9ACTN|nr:hypothetical protein Pma05_55860 [Plantactinospora mayteni]
MRYGIGHRGRAVGALGFAVGYGLLRLYWAGGGRWGYTACDRTRSPGPVEIADGCGAERLATLPFWSGWGAVLLCALLVVVAGMATLTAGGNRPAGSTRSGEPLGRFLRSGRTASVGAWAAAAALVVLSFPGHLLFEIPMGLAGRPTDWPDLLGRLLLLGGGLSFAATAASATDRGYARPGPPGPRPVPGWTRRWTYAACLLPTLGFTVPHACWLLGIPLGIPADELRRAVEDIGLLPGLLLTLAPMLGGLLTLGLAARWGQVLPRWLPGLAGRRVPPTLALAPAGVVAVALTAYGLIGLAMLTEALATGATNWAELRSGWAVAGTELVFLAWGIALGVAAVGYFRTTRPLDPHDPHDPHDGHDGHDPHDPHDPHDGHDGHDGQDRQDRQGAQAGVGSRAVAESLSGRAGS